jgi:hypothetical protein
MGAMDIVEKLRQQTPNAYREWPRIGPARKG